ncbi:MAG: hypothetical protein KatS3mg011_0909 [Acidimicrobiia bacterium]|nr:MAG: hypothetical protein KatS3mg011_0909 [Acidimicrobiia bacterium]
MSVAAHVFGGEPEGLASIRRAVDEYEKGDLRGRLARHHDDPDGAFRGWADTWLHPGFVRLERRVVSRRHTGGRSW